MLPKLGTRHTQLQRLKKNHSKNPFKGEFPHGAKGQHKKAHPSACLKTHIT